MVLWGVAALPQVVDKSIPWMPRVEVIDAKRCEMGCRQACSLARAACNAMLLCQVK
jgi:hypothetical protein